MPEESISSSEPKTLPYDESRPQAYKPANFYYDPHFNYDVTNSTSIGRLSNPSEVSFPQSSKSSGSFSQQNYLSLALKSKLSSYEDNRISPKINTWSRTEWSRQRSIEGFVWRWLKFFLPRWFYRCPAVRRSETENCNCQGIVRKTESSNTGWSSEYRKWKGNKYEQHISLNPFLLFIVYRVI